jgi:hypothetical protein
MFAPFAEDSYKKLAEYEALKARGDDEAASRYNDACAREGLSYGMAGLKLIRGDIPGFINEAKKGTEARVEQRRIVDGAE